MSGQKRMRSDLNDDMSSVARDEESEEGMSSPKSMRNESNDETSTVSNKDIFSSSDDGKSSEEADHASNEGESSEETNDSDEETDPWRVLIDEAAGELRTNTVNLCKVLKMKDLEKLTRRNKPLHLFYQSFERNWEMFI